MIILSVLYEIPTFGPSFVRMAFPRYAFKFVSDTMCLEPVKERGNPPLCSVKVGNETFYVKESFDEIVQQLEAKRE